MKTFAEIRDLAIARKGEAAYEAAMPAPPDWPMSALPDDRLLSEFTKRVFQAGFNWSVIESKWPGFEAAFHGFDIGRNAMMSDEDLDAHLRNTDIVRNAAKILTVRDNAVFLSDLARAHGSAAGYLAAWPIDDTIGLFDLLKKRGARLGGVTGQYALRNAGYDAFILSRSVLAALNAHGVIDGAATSKGAQRKVQAAFNAWHAESGARHAVISRTLALSVPD
ncbi:DNA-3-methyladenine glycosylase I [Tropicimonas sediminicola]|uniref:DNA-3-methyladenine glycosylase I n=1 Tax=Tropicimonas sediminicola TaxID=1031541 RepID=A0A239I4R1_9RHOB|nr:DNA-3-methyladenine glycosylase I [Tropicimonas sediminicola]SNS88063.1 DNA-3-methyladenine glycosylase I [Tropicimonas sediminicola]